MKMNWLLDADMFERYRDDLVAEIKALGHEVKLIHPPKPGYSWDDEGCSYRKTFPADACVVTHGDIDLCTRIHREERWRPGVFATVKNYLCSNYFCHLGEFLLNSDYVMLPFGELERCKEFLFQMIGVEGTIFVRPDSPLKLFSGQTASHDTFDADLEVMGFYDFPHNSLVVVSSPKQIAVEWRFVVADGLVVAGSEYMREGKFDPLPGFDPEARSLAAKVAEAYQPDPVSIVDICQTSDGKYHLLEIGGFSYADLYATDKGAVAGAVSDAAIKIWRD